MTQIEAHSSPRFGAGEQNNAADSTAAKCWREVELLGHGIVVGGITDGVTQIGDHPLQFVGGLAGAAGLAMALKGPTWLKVPAIGLSVLGNIGFGLHAYDCVRSAAPAFANAWSSSNGMDKNFAIADRSVGSLAFDAAVMLAAGKGTAKLAEAMPRSGQGLQRSFSTRLDGLSDSIANSIGIGRSSEFAYATGSGGGGRYGGFEVVMPENPGRIPLNEDLSSELGRPMMMAASGTGGGASDVNYRSWKEGASTIHEFNNVPPGGRSATLITHGDKVTTALGLRGNVEVKFTDGQSRTVALGKNINKVRVTERPGGVKEFRINGGTAADIIVNPDLHLLSAKTADSVVHQFDAGNTPFKHAMGGNSLLLNSGHVESHFLDGQVRALNLKQSISRVHLTESFTGNNEFRFDGRTEPDLITNSNAHFMTARMPGNEKVHVFDITSTPFESGDRLQTSFSRDGQITFRLPDGSTRSASVGATIDQIMVLEAKDGTKTFVTYAARNNPASRNANWLTVPHLNNRTFWTPPPPKIARTPPPPRMPQTAGPIGSMPSQYSFGATPGAEEPASNRYPFWRLNIPGSVKRGIFDEVVGIDHRAMPGSNMDRITELGIAWQKHDWYVEDYLTRLDGRK